MRGLYEYEEAFAERPKEAEIKAEKEDEAKGQEGFVNSLFRITSEARKFRMSRRCYRLRGSGLRSVVDRSFKGFFGGTNLLGVRG